jgi:polyvinyl alcohol dehydrogenase (cytochrome)
MRGLAGPLSRATAVGALALSALLMVAGAGASGASRATRAATASGGGSSWTVYHGNAAGSGVSDSVSAVATSAPAWTSPALDGRLYGEPLVSGGDVYVATEDDTVYALSAATGAVVWSTHVASPVPSSMLPCGDITPSVGITGTPVIDPSRNEIFVVADELVNGAPAHKLIGLSTTSGAIKLDEDVDPPGADPAALLQRTGLTLDAGQVVFGMGGNDGDCATYKGRVVAVEEAGGSPTYFTVDAASGDSQGAIWMGGAAPAVDGNGDIWVAAGNGSVYSAGRPYDDSDSALELSSSLQLLQYFAPTTWPQNNAHDLDMSMAPALLSDGQVVLAGKSRIVYLLDGSRLGGIGGQEASLGAACSEDIDGGSAVVGTTVYLPCPTGPVAVTVTASPAALTVQWTSRVGGGPPIVAAGLVWTIGQNGTLYGLDPSTGTVRQQVSIGVPANHFPTPSVGDGLLLAPSSDRVVAFQATPTSSTPTSSTPTTPTTSGPSPTSTTVPRGNAAGASGSGSGGGTSPGEIAGIVAAGVIVLGGGSWVLLRRRRRGVRP